MKPLDALRLVWSAREGGRGTKGGAAVTCASSLSPTERGVLTSLVRRRNDKTGRCDPGVRTLAEDTGMTVQGVRGVLDRLEAAGLVKMDRAVGRSTRYEIHLDPLAQLCKSVAQCKSLVLCKQLGGGVQASSTALCKPVALNCLSLPDELPSIGATDKPSPPKAKGKQSGRGKQPDPLAAPAQLVVDHLNATLIAMDEPGIPSGAEWGGQVRMAKGALRKGWPADELTAALTWAATDPFWRGRLMSERGKLLGAVRAAWKESQNGRGGKRRHHHQLDDGPRKAEGAPW